MGLILLCCSERFSFLFLVPKLIFQLPAHSFTPEPFCHHHKYLCPRSPHRYPQARSPFLSLWFSLSRIISLWPHLKCGIQNGKVESQEGGYLRSRCHQGSRKENCQSSQKLKGHWHFWWSLLPSVSAADTECREASLKFCHTEVSLSIQLLASWYRVFLCWSLVWSCRQSFGYPRVNPSHKAWNTLLPPCPQSAVTRLLLRRAKGRYLLMQFYGTDGPQKHHFLLNYLICFTHILRAKSFFQ